MAAMRPLFFLVFFLVVAASVTALHHVERCKVSAFVFNNTILCDGKCTVHEEGGAYIESGIALEFCRPWERTVNCTITDDCFCCVENPWVFNIAV